MKRALASRRRFGGLVAAPLARLVQAAGAPPVPRGGQARVRLAVVGFGQQGGRLGAAAAAIPGVEIAGVADLYDGRLARAREVFGGSVDVTRDARVLLDRRDVDAVVVSTADHAHLPLVAAAVAAGKDVYCEAPVIHRWSERDPALALSLADRIVQGGAGFASMPLFRAARAVLEEGRLGRVLEARAVWETCTALEAWQVPFPPDASPETIDVARFVGAAGDAAPPLDLRRFFRWRCYREFGSGLAGARVAPLLTALHWLTGVDAPVRVRASGLLQRWKDGRDVPDTLSATLTYENELSITITTSLSGLAPREIRIAGTEATLVLDDRALRLEAAAHAEPYAHVGETWPREHRNWFYMMHGLTAQGQPRTVPGPERTVERFELPAPPDAGAPLAEFIDCVRTRRQPQETYAMAIKAAAATARAADMAADEGAA